MNHLASILVVAEDSAFGLDVISKLRSHGYDARLVSSKAAALATAQQAHPDVLIIGRSMEGGDPLELTQELRANANSSDIPVCLLAANPTAELRWQALEVGIDDVVPSPFTEAKLMARLRPLVRLSTMHTELRQRSFSAANFGVKARQSLTRDVTTSDYPVILIGERVDDLIAALPDAKLAIATDPYQAESLLEQTNFDVAVVSPGENVGSYLDLCDQVRNNPRLFNLPVLMVNDDSRINEELAYRHGASAYLDRPLDSRSLGSTTLSLVRRQRLRWSIRKALMETLQPTTKDSATGVYNRSFLNAYLTNQLDFAKIHGRHLSVAFLRIPDVDGIRQNFGEEQAQHLRLQLAQWITGLLRGEDLTARYDENEFCVVLPDTPKSEADLVTHRIAGVLAYTDFAVKDVYQPVKVWVRVGGAELNPDDDVTSFINRARQDIAW